MPDPFEEATALADLLNAWANNDILNETVAVAPCTLPSLPRKPEALWSLLPGNHRKFYEELTITGSTKLGPTVHHNTASYDPTERCHYHRHPEDHPETLKARTAAQDFFQGRPVDVIEGQGNHRGPYEFDFDFAVVLDAKNGLIFSFIWNLQD